MNNFLLEAKISQLNSVKQYLKLLSKFPLVSPEKIKVGYFYATDYRFSHEYTKNILDYFDKFPLNYVFNSNGIYYNALNFHFVPVLNRSGLMNKIKNANLASFKKEGFFKTKISYRILRNLYNKSKYCVRLYRRDRVAWCRQIPNKDMFELVKYAPPTYFKVGIDQIMDRHRNYPSPEQLKESLGYDFETFQPNNQRDINILTENLFNPFPTF